MKYICIIKCLTVVPSNESKEKIEKYEELWIKIRDLIRSKTKSLVDYVEKYLKIILDSDGIWPLNKTIEIPIVTIVIRAVFYKNNKNYQQVFLDKCLYKI